MNILFFHTYQENSAIFEIQAEIILKHLDAGDFVTIVFDNKKIVASHMKYSYTRFKKYQNQLFFKKMLDLFSSNENRFEVVPYILSGITKEDLPPFENIEDLKRFKYNGINIGMPIASSVISNLRDHEFNTINNRRNILREFEVATSVLVTIEFYVKEKNIDYAYVYNGRLAAFAPVVIFCQKNKIPFSTYEFTGNLNKYHIVLNTIPHNISYRNDEIYNLWRNENFFYDEKIKIASNFFERSRSGTLDTEDFTSYQNKNKKILLDPAKEIITFFNSSIDEFASVPGWEKYIYLFKNEVEAILAICKHYEKDDSKQFILRIHPNLKFLNNTQTKNLKRLESLENLIIYPAESDCFSYQLIDISDKIITFGSTIGVEACYFGKVSICLGLSLYEYLDVAYIPQSINELFALIDNKELTPKPKENSYLYGFAIMTFGEDFLYRKKGVYTSDYFSFRGKEVLISLLKKAFSIQMLKNIFFMLNPKFYKKMKYPEYRRTFRKKISNLIKLKV